jgi:hypothetical protein
MAIMQFDHALGAVLSNNNSASIDHMRITIYPFKRPHALPDSLAM